MNLAFNLFLLMQTLSNLHQKKKIIRLFLESISDLFSPTIFEFLEKKKLSTGDVIPISTHKNSYGFLKYDASTVIDETHKILILNAIQMLAVILERLELNKNLSKERNTFEQLADSRLAELQQMVEELSSANSASINLIEDLNIEINKRTQSEQELKVSEEKYRSLFNANKDGISIFRIDQDSKTSNFIECNDAAVEILGYTRDELMSLNVIDLESDVTEEIRKQRMVTLQTKGSINFETIVKNKIGSNKVLDVKVVVIDYKNQPALMNISRDITERKHAEEKLQTKNEEYEALNEELQVQNEELQTTEQELRESKEDFKGYFEMGSVGMCITSPGKGWLEVNERLLQMLGYTKTELTHFTWADLTHPDDLNSDNEFFNQILEGKIDKYELDKRFICKDGSVIYTTLSVACHRNSDGRVNYFLASLIDITLRKQAEDKIKALLAEKELLLKEVHHRIKNNMMTMYSVLSLQAQALDDPAAIAAFEDAGRRMKSMSLLYDKLYQSSGFTELPMKLYLSPLIDEILVNFSKSKSVKVEKNIDDFILDAKRLQSFGILINELLTNCMKYAFIGRDDGLLTVSATLKDGQVTISVADNGNGIPESIDFEKSTGFGLMLVNLLTKQLEGTIRIERNNGTAIILEFAI